MPSKFTKIIGGKKYTAYGGYKTRQSADKVAKGLRKDGIPCRILAASEHDKKTHGINYNIMAR